MTKPTEKPTFATDVNYAVTGEPWGDTPTKVQPVPAQIASGFKPSRRPPAQTFNWLFGNIADWIDYLDTSVFADVNSVVANIVELDPDGSGDLGNIGVVRLEMAGGYALRSMIDGEHGRRVLITNWYHPDPNPYYGEQSFTVLHMDPAGTGKKFFLPRPDYDNAVDDGAEGVPEIMVEPGGSILVMKDDDRDAWVVIGVCGARKRSALSVNIAFNYTTLNTVGRYFPEVTGQLLLDSHTDDIYIPFNPELGSIITGFRLAVTKNTNNATVTPITAGVEQGVGAAVNTFSTDSNSAISPGAITLEVPAKTDRCVVVRDSSYWVKVSPTGNNVPSADTLHYLTVYLWTPILP